MIMRGLLRRWIEKRDAARQRKEQLNAYRDEFLVVLSQRMEADALAGNEDYLAGLEATTELRERHPELTDELMRRIIGAANRKGFD